MSYRLDLSREGSGHWVYGVAGENLVTKDLVYLDGNGRWQKADADAITTMPVTGMMLEECEMLEVGRILLNGFIGDPSWSWVVGGNIYGSQTPGLLIQTAPVDPALTQRVGIAVTSTLIRFNPKTVVSIYTPPAYATPVDIGAANAEGALDQLVRSDHVHRNSEPATKEFSVPAQPTSATETLGGLGVRLDADGKRAGFQFSIPHDFSSLISAVIRVKPDANGVGKNIDLQSYYSQTGEAWNIHSESDIVSTYNFTVNLTTDIDVSGILTSLAAGDKVSVLITMKESFSIWVGTLRVRYA